MQIKLSMILFLCIGLLAIVGPFVIDIWLGGKVEVEPMMYGLFAIHAALSIWSNVFAYFVNALEKLTVQLITSVTAAIANIPLSIFFVKGIGMGLEGVVIATILSVSVFAIAGPFQVYNFLSKNK